MKQLLHATLLTIFAVIILMAGDMRCDSTAVLSNENGVIQSPTDRLSITQTGLYSNAVLSNSSGTSSTLQPRIVSSFVAHHVTNSAISSPFHVIRNGVTTSNRTTASIYNYIKLHSLRI